MKNFLHTIRSSFYDPQFYEAVQAKPLRSALWVFVLLGMFGIALALLRATPEFVHFANSDFPQQVKDAYPDDLVIKIENGEMSVNQPEPYYLPNTLFEPDEAKYIAIFDTNDELSSSLYENSTYALLKKKFAITYGQNEQQQLIPWSEVGTTTVDKSMVVGLVDKAEPYFKPVLLGGGALFFILAVVVGAFVWALFHMVYVLIPAAVVWLFSRTRTNKLSYRNAYAITLYASIPVAILFYVVFCWLVSYPAPIFAYTLLVLIFAIINMGSDTKPSVPNE